MVANNFNAKFGKLNGANRNSNIQTFIFTGEFNVFKNIFSQHSFVFKISSYGRCLQNVCAMMKC